MAVDELFEIAPEVSIKRHSRAMLKCETKRFREQPHMRLGRTKNRYGPRVVLDHYLCACANAPHERGEVARRFRFRDVDHMLGPDVIIHRCSSSGANDEAQGCENTPA